MPCSNVLVNEQIELHMEEDKGFVNTVLCICFFKKSTGSFLGIIWTPSSSNDSCYTNLYFGSVDDTLKISDA